MISFRIDWFDLLDVQGTLKSLLQHHSLKTSIRHSTFIMVQLCICTRLLERWDNIKSSNCDKEHKCSILEMHLELKDQQLKAILFIYRLLYQNLMIT